MSTAPFVERYRPEDLDSIVLPVDIKLRLKAFAATGEFPQACAFYGDPGLGKTTSALAVIKEYYVRRGVYPPDTTLDQIRANSPTLLKGTFIPSLFVASRTQGTIDFIRGPFTRFLQGAPPSPDILKLVVFDEADAMSNDAKEALLPLIERYTGSRIIFTTNMEPVFGLGPAIVSRAAGCTFEFQKPSKDEIVTYLRSIAEKEGVGLAAEAFNSIADTTKDVREAVGMLGADIALVKARETPMRQPKFKIGEVVLVKSINEILTIVEEPVWNTKAKEFVYGLKKADEKETSFYKESSLEVKPEEKPKIEAIPFMAGAKIYYYASYNRPYSVIEIRQDIDGGTLVRPKGKIEFGEPFAIIQRDEPLPEKAIKSLELKQISADKIPPWWATAVRTEIPRFIYGKVATPEELKAEYEALTPEEKTKIIEMEEEEATKPPKEFPPIPKTGITEEWVEEVLSIDPYVKPEVERKRAGEYDIIYYKNINGEDMALSMQTGLPFKLTRDTLLEGKMNRMKWNGKDVTIPAGWEDDEERFETVYPRAGPDGLTALSQNQLRDVARIKGIGTTGTFSEIVDRILEAEGKQAPKEVAPVPPAPAPIPSRTKEEAIPPPPARITDADAKTLEEAFRAEMALRGIPLKSSTTDYLAVFKAYLREATTKGVSPDRFKSNWLPNVVSSIEEVYSNRTTVATQEVTRRIVNADARFKRDDIVDMSGELRRILDVKLNADTGTYEYQLEGVEGMVDESSLKPANIPRAKYQVGDNVVRSGLGFIIQNRKFDSVSKKWVYELKKIEIRTGEMG